MGEVFSIFITVAEGERMERKTSLISDLRPLIFPKSIAIFGVSSDLSKLTGMPLRYLMNHGYRGKIFLINAKYDQIGGHRCYPALSAIPPEEEIDLAMIILPARAVYGTVKECIERGVKAAIVFSSGFAEIGPEGRQLQEQLRELVRGTNFLLCGPNTDGIGAPHERIPLGFATSMELLPPGQIGLVTQSGAIMNSIVFRCRDRGLGFTYHICAGNEAHLESSDYIKFMLDDPRTRLILAFIEGFKDGQKFLEVADYALDKQKPIIVLKVGRSEKGSRAAASHTGALTGSDKVHEAVFKQKGVLRADDLDDLVATALLFEKCPLPVGSGVGVISVSGGAMGIMADKAAEIGVDLPDLSPPTQKRLRELFYWAQPTNPFDLTGQMASNPELLVEVLRLFLADPQISFLVVTVTPFPSFFTDKFFVDIIEVAKDSSKPLVVCSMRGILRPDYAQVLEQANIPLLHTPEECFKAIKALMTYSKYLERHRQRKTFSKGEGLLNEDEVGQIRRWLMKRAQRILSERESKALLSRYGIPVTREALARSIPEALTIAQGIGYPVALKVESPQIIHKTEAGCVKLQINGPEELVQAYEEIMANARDYQSGVDINGVLVQEMVEGGLEVIIGLSRDPQFGLTIMFGLGGIFVELLEDIALRLVPITRDDAQEMLQEIKGYKLLEGFRGQPTYDQEALIETLLKVSRLAEDLESQIEEMDLNPVKVFEAGRGIKVVDSLLVLQNS